MIYFKALRIKWRLIIGFICVITALVGLYSFVSAAVQNQAIESMSWSLVNKVIVVDPGHGGADGGGVGPSRVEEKTITLEIGKKLALKLSQAGSAVVLTREDDSDLGSPGQRIADRKREDLRKRVKLANEKKADLYISVHTNCFGTEWTGAQTFYSPRSEESERLAECIQSEIIRLIGNTDRKILPLETYILDNVEMPAVTVEVGFLSNSKEEKMLQDPEYQNKMAYAIYAGTVKYFASDEKIGE